MPVRIVNLHTFSGVLFSIPQIGNQIVLHNSFQAFNRFIKSRSTLKVSLTLTKLITSLQIKYLVRKDINPRINERKLKVSKDGEF